MYQIQRDLASLTQGTLSVTAFFTKLKTLWDEYVLLLKVPVCSCGAGSFLHKILQNQHIMQFLMGLNDSFNVVRGTILLMRPFPDLDEIFKLVVQEEKQREIVVHGSFGSANSNSSAFTSFGRGCGRGFVNNPSSGRGRGCNNNYFCEHCKMSGHSISRCYKLSGKFCDHCKIPGHTIAKCYKLQANPPQFSSDKRIAATVSTETSTPALTNEQYHQLLGLLSQHSIESPASPTVSSSAMFAGPFNEGNTSAW